MIPIDPEQTIDRLKELQSAIRAELIRCRRSQPLHQVKRASDADTIYSIDAAIDPIIEEFCREWAKTTPLVLVAEGLRDPSGREGARVFPEGAPEAEAQIRVILDPIDGTREIMYDKRAAWTLAAVAPNLGPATRLRDAGVSVMTELPTTKMGLADVLWASRGRGAHGARIDLCNLDMMPILPQPSQADGIEHGFAGVSNFFPGTKVLASQLMEHIVERMIDSNEITRAVVFEDQYISTGGQFHELIVGHDRFNADLRPLFFRAQDMAEGMCCHPYDCAALLIAEEAGVIITDGAGQALDAPLDTTTGVSWIGYANPRLRARVEPRVLEFLRSLPASRG